jgi:hypothetical protein
VPFWDGASLPERMPDPRLFVRCRPCDCSEGALQPWDDWERLNRRAYAQLRLARAPYPVAIVPGFHAGGPVVWHRLKAALRLLKEGWVGALVLSGGHRRGGYNEARMMLSEVERLAVDLEVDTKDRVFVEPCAVVTLTNFRNSLRMLAALGLEQGVLVTDSKMSGQAMVFYNSIEKIAAEHLACPVGRMTYLFGDGPLPQLIDTDSGCRPRFSIRNNPLGFFLPTLRATVFWVSPQSADGGDALACAGGSDRLIDREPDNEDPFSATCLPMVGRTVLSCPAQPPDRPLQLLRAPFD